MPICDLCGAEVGSHSMLISAEEFKLAVESGLRPPEQIWELTTAFGLPRSHSEKEWVTKIVMPNYNDWLLCSSCSTKWESYRRKSKPDGHQRLEEVREIAEKKDASRLDFLIERLLEDPEEFVRWNAAIALGKIKDPRSIKPLITALKDQSRITRKDVLKALREFNDPEANNAINQFEEREKEERQKKEREEKEQEELRVRNIKALRTNSKRCIMCGKALGFFDQLLFRDRHPDCKIFKID